MLVVLTFEELKKQLRTKVVTVVSARLDYANDAIIAETFDSSDLLLEVKSYCGSRYGESIPFLEIDRIEDRFLIRLIDETTKLLEGKG